MVVVAGTPELAPSDLRARRESAGLSRPGLAALLGISEGALRHWEAGRKPIPAARVDELLRALAGQAPAEAATAMPGHELRRLREQQELTQNELAHLLGVSRRAVIAWEQGDVPEQRRDVLRQALAGDEGPAVGLMRALRERAGWTQAELGERVGVPQTRISAWERGELPVPLELWPRIRDVLVAAEPDIRPTQFQRPVDGAELRAGRRRLGWSQGDLAERLGLSKPTIGAWEAALKPVPEARWQHIREVLGTGQPKPSVERRADAVRDVVGILEAEPGLSRSEVVARADTRRQLAGAAVAQALEEGLVHERRVLRERADGLVRRMPVLFPGPAPDELPDVELAELVEPKAVTSIAAEPGRTRHQVGAALPHSRKVSEQAIARALDRELVHERAVVAAHDRGHRMRLGLFPGAAPAPAPAIPGDELRALRARMALGQGELAERLHVGPGLVRQWEQGEVPVAWRVAVAEALREVAAEAPARDAALRAKIVATVRDEPGLPRWGRLARRVRSIERAHLARLLDELVAAGELHERAVDGRVGLFPGPPPPEWEPGPPLSADELHAMREWSGLSQRRLAQRIRAGVASVNAWENGTEPVPSYRRAQLRAALAERRPPEPPLGGDELRAERKRVGWTQAELGATVGVLQATVSKWERGADRVPPQVRARLRELLANAPAAPRVSRRELRRWRRAQGLTLRELGQQLGAATQTVADWEKGGVPLERAADVRALIDQSTEPAQGNLFA